MYVLLFSSNNDIEICNLKDEHQMYELTRMLIDAKIAIYSLCTNVSHYRNAVVNLFNLKIHNAKEPDYFGGSFIYAETFKDALSWKEWVETIGVMNTIIYKNKILK